MFVKNFILFVHLFVLHTCIGNGNVDMDYIFYRPAMRSKTLSCKNDLQQIYCQIKCGAKSAICVQKDCYCLTVVSPNEDIGPNSQTLGIDSDYHINMNYEDGDEPHMLQNMSPISEQDLYGLRPTLRHHIAHFCPNLDVARECIKKCIPEGKPAFCGKDHVCYCGHKYTHSDDNVNVTKMYVHFKDLYKKYYGNVVDLDDN